MKAILLALWWYFSWLRLRQVPRQQASTRGYIRIMEKKMETTIVYWGYIGIMDKKMETTTVYTRPRMKLGVIRTYELRQGKEITSHIMPHNNIPGLRPHVFLKPKSLNTTPYTVYGFRVP